MRHTPGPWTYWRDNNQFRKPEEAYFIAPAITLPTFAHVYNYPSEVKANARLIAAAPELYEHGKQVLRQLAFLNNSPVKEKDYMNLAKAIAKVEGKE